MQFADRIRRLDIVVSSAFPFSPARIVLVDRPDFLTWPHVEKHGVLCLIPEHTTLSVDDPYGAVADLLEMAFDLIEGFARGDYHDEFRAELLSYWDNETTLRGRTMLSLIRPSEPTRIVRVWEGLQHIIIADSDDDLRPWLLNRYPPLRRTRLRIRDGVFVRLGQVPLPSEYPGTARDVYGLAAEAGAAELLDRVAREVPNRLLVAFGALTSNGPAVVATIVKRPAVARGSILSSADSVRHASRSRSSKQGSSDQPPRSKRR